MKIDVNSINGYSEMTPEQKLEALEGYEFNVDYTGYVKKEVLDQTAHEAADWKKKYNARLTDEEKASAERQQELDSMREELESLRREKTISSYTADYLALGYDEKLAKDTAEAVADGDFARVMANQKKFLAKYEQTVQANLLKDTPRPESVGGNVTRTKAEIMAIKDPTERQKAIAENYELFI